MAKIRQIQVGSTAYEIAPKILLTLNMSNATETATGYRWTITTAQYNECVDAEANVVVKIVGEGYTYFMHRFMIMSGVAAFNELDTSDDNSAGTVVKAMAANESGTCTFVLMQGETLASDSHIHSVTAAGNVGVTLTKNDSTGTGRIKYLEASSFENGVLTLNTKYLSASGSFTGTAVDSGQPK